MPINNPLVGPTARQPRLRVLSQGRPIGGALQFEVLSNGFFQSDTFTAQFAFRYDPNYPLSWWGDQKELLIDIQSSLDGGQSWVSHIIGDIDHLSVHVEQGIIVVDGRDLTSRFIDNRTQETFLNKTSSQVVETLAARRGLTADVTLNLNTGWSVLRAGSRSHLDGRFQPLHDGMEPALQSWLSTSNSTFG
jgi:hypothetical protein